MLFESIILNEGGKALTGKKISQAGVKKILPELRKQVAEVLGIPVAHVVLVGSAGKKPNPDDLSGDIDLAVKADPAKVESALPDLAYDGKSYKAMAGIRAYSFLLSTHEGKVQVDLLPVNNLKHAEWSYAARESDLRKGLKGAHRNELLFAIATHADVKVRKHKDGEPLEIERYFYDLSKGLDRGIKTKLKDDKVKKNFATQNRKLVTDDPVKVVHILFGRSFTPADVATFQGALNAIRSPEFRHAKHREEILKQAIKGIKSKGLQVPEVLKSPLDESLLSQAVLKLQAEENLMKSWTLKDIWRSMEKAGYLFHEQDGHLYKGFRYLGRSKRGSYVFALLMRNDEYQKPEVVDLHKLHSNKSKLKPLPPAPTPTTGPYEVVLWFWKPDNPGMSDFGGSPEAENLSLEAAKKFMNEYKLK